jgi:hypothetical protein
MAREEYARSARTARCRVRGRPGPLRGTQTEDYWRWTMSGVRRSRGRRKKETEPATPPEPTTSTLWA